MLDDGEDGNPPLLRGVVLCSTSLSQELRNKLSEIAVHTGAAHHLDLTADVTHLIVGNIDTPKYKHTAKQRPDIHVLKPEWIHAILKLWTEDQDIDADALFEEYRLPAFYNLHISVTGFDDIEQRQELIQKIGNNGAIYHGDLTREVTNLIVSRPSGPKYERAKTWNLKITSLKWLDESLGRGMAVDESLYHPLMPLDDQGKGAFIRGYQRPSVLGKRQREITTTHSKEEAGKRRLRRTASAKLANHSQNMLSSFQLMGEDGGLEDKSDQWTDVHDDTLELKPSRNITPSMSVNEISNLVSEVPTLPAYDAAGLFSRVLCLVHGHNDRRATKIEEILTSNEGQIAQTAEELYSALEKNRCDRTVLILPSEWTSGTKGSLPEVPAGTWSVTEWWLERCIKQKSVLDPDTDVLSQPHLNLPIDGFRGLSISTSGMGNDILHVSKVVLLAGASYDQNLIPKTSVLVVSATPNSDKIAYAAKHRIAVVSEDWLFSSLVKSQKMPLCEYAAAGHSKDIVSHRQPDHPTSREGSARPSKDKRKDDPQAQRLSAIRKRNVAPSLPLYKTGTTPSIIQQKSHKSRKGPFIEEDATSDDENLSTHQDMSRSQGMLANDASIVLAEDGKLQNENAHGTRPLQNLSPRMNSVTRQSISSLPGEGENQMVSSIKPNNEYKSYSTEMSLKERNTSAPGTDPAQANQSRLDGKIKSLLERQHSAPSVAEPTPKRRWKERKLGRAPSGTSSSSASASFRQTASMDMVESVAQEDLPGVGIPVPSQQLTYETPGAQEYRARMSKKMGTVLVDDNIGTRVESLGLVRDIDTDASTGVGGRVRGRQRSAKNQV